MSKPKTCGETKAPKGWTCTRERGHAGPCAAVPKRGFWGRALDGFGEALGEFMFGGQR